MDTTEYYKWFETGVIVAMVISGFTYALSKAFKFMKVKKTKKDEERFNYVNMRIWNMITSVRERTKASRVSLVQFHNGGKFADGSSMRRMSISSQTCDPKISSTMQFRQDVLVSRFVEIVEMLQENDPRIRMVFQQRDSNTKKFYELHDTVAFSILPIYCSDSMIALGYISVEWCDLGTLDKMDDQELLPFIENTRSQIAFLISSAKDYR
jgi:hypothetical protein